MSTVPIAKPVETAMASAKVAYLVQLIKDNQLVTALIVFVAWQVGLIADAQAAVAGVC